MQTVEEFTSYRPALIGLAYRMLGSVMDAEDIVQEAFIRWQQESTITSPKSYLMTVVARLCIDHMRLARVQREEYIGSWLPEPLLEAVEPDPASISELTDTLSTAFMIVLERLAPIDRAVFILHDVFGYTFEEIGQIVGRTSADCRQIAHRARAKLTAERQHPAIPPERIEQITQQFIRACIDGDMDGLVALLTGDVTLWTDSGGKLKAVRNPIYGVAKVARYFILTRGKAEVPSTLKIAWISGQIAVIEYVGSELSRLNTFDFDESGIRAIYRIVNPDKLQQLEKHNRTNKAHVEGQE